MSRLIESGALRSVAGESIRSACLKRFPKLQRVEVKNNESIRAVKPRHRPTDELEKAAAAIGARGSAEKVGVSWSVEDRLVLP